MNVLIIFLDSAFLKINNINETVVLTLNFHALKFHSLYVSI